MKRYAIVRQSDALVRSIVSAEDISTLMMNCPAGCDPVPCPDPAVVPDDWQWKSGGFSKLPIPEPLPADLRADLVASVKSAAEGWRMRVMSPGGSKKTVYSNKQSEVEAFRALGSSLTGRLAALLGLESAVRARKFRYAIADAAIRGEPDISKAIERFTVGADASNAEAARIEAIEQFTVDKLNAAKTVAEMRAIYAAVKWQ
ncbi:hypothetical protein [Sphingomonas sp. SAFR-052]|uniref:hypothetical protein n=1 Tax=Sphingomonas sp. SAFR-052 TaxID=3436867 RepID=UPI003F81997D